MPSSSSYLSSKYDSASLLFMKSRVVKLLDIKDRRYHLRQYKKCFVCSDLINSMIKFKIVKSRDEGVELGLAIQKQLKLWRHVVDDHDFSDDYLFFRLETDFEDESSSSSSSPTRGNGNVRSKMMRRKQQKKQNIEKNSSSSVATATTTTYYNYSDSFIFEDEDDDDVASLDDLDYDDCENSYNVASCE